MGQVCNESLIIIDRKPSGEWAKLIRKLPWIGMETEARRLALALCTLPPEERGVSAGPRRQAVAISTCSRRRAESSRKRR
jgi:hypothetical protein